MYQAQLVLAQTIFGEARGEGRVGMEAVAHTILNRAAAPGWWGDSIISVAKKPKQYSAWNDGDPNSKLIQRKGPGQGDPVFDLAWAIAGDAMAGKYADPTGGATHYYNPKVVNPAWADPAKKTVSIGNHDFFLGIS